MTSEFRALGTAIYFDTATDIALTLTLTGTGSATINSSDSAYLTIPAGSYWRTPDLCNYVAYKTRAWIFAAITADGGVTKSSFVVTDFAVTFTVSPSLTVNGSLFTFKITNNAGAHLKIGGTNAALTAVTLTNTNGLWSKFGLFSEASASDTMTVAANVATKTGRFQPRSLFFFLRSEIDDGETEQAVLVKNLVKADGTISVYESGRHIAKRSLRLVDLDENIAGRPVSYARLGDNGIAASRVGLNINTVSSVFSSGSTNQIDSLYLNNNVDPAGEPTGKYLLLPGAWVGRIDDTTDPTLLTLWEKIPANITPPTACALTIISEVHALFFEALRTGYLFVYHTVETPGSTFGSVLWVSSDYCLDESNTTWSPERRSIGLPAYSFTFNLLRRDAPGITQTSNP